MPPEVHLPEWSCVKQKKPYPSRQPPRRGKRALKNCARQVCLKILPFVSLCLNPQTQPEQKSCLEAELGPGQQWQLGLEFLRSLRAEDLDLRAFTAGMQALGIRCVSRQNLPLSMQRPARSGAAGNWRCSSSKRWKALFGSSWLQCCSHCSLCFREILHTQTILLWKRPPALCRCDCHQCCHGRLRVSRPKGMSDVSFKNVVFRRQPPSANSESSLQILNCQEQSATRS